MRERRCPSSRIGRHATGNRSARGASKPETFDFVGFTHICATSKTGRFWVKRIAIKKRMRVKLKAVKAQIKQRRYLPIPVQGAWLASVVRGHRAYYCGRSRNSLGLRSRYSAGGGSW